MHAEPCAAGMRRVILDIMCYVWTTLPKALRCIDWAQKREYEAIRFPPNDRQGLGKLLLQKSVARLSRGAIMEKCMSSIDVQGRWLRNWPRIQTSGFRPSW